MLFLSNLVLLLFALLAYYLFRAEIFTYCRIKRMRKRDIYKNLKGVSNFWLYSQLHKQINLGVLYYLNLIYLFTLASFFTIFAISWFQSMKIPVIAFGGLLGLAIIPASFATLIISNVETFGRAFVFFEIFKGYNGKIYRFVSIFDWIFPFLPLALYVFLITR